MRFWKKRQAEPIEIPIIRDRPLIASLPKLLNIYEQPDFWCGLAGMRDPSQEHDRKLITDYHGIADGLKAGLKAEEIPAVQAWLDRRMAFSNSG